MSEISPSSEIKVQEAIADLISRYVRTFGAEEDLVLQYSPTIFDDYMCRSATGIDINKTQHYQLVSVSNLSPESLSRALLLPLNFALQQRIAQPSFKNIFSPVDWNTSRIGIVFSGRDVGHVVVAAQEGDDKTTSGVCNYALSGRYYALGILYAIVATSYDLSNSFDVVLCCSNLMSSKVREMLEQGCQLIYDDTDQFKSICSPIFSDASVFELLPVQSEFAASGQMLPFTPIMNNPDIGREQSNIARNHWMSRRASAFRSMCADVFRPLGISDIEGISIDTLLDIVETVSNRHEYGFEYLRGWHDTNKHPTSSLEYKHIRDAIPVDNLVDSRARLRDAVRIWYAIGQDCQISFNLSSNGENWNKVKIVRDALGIDCAVDSYYAGAPLSMIIGEDAAFSETIGQWMIT